LNAEFNGIGSWPIGEETYVAEMEEIRSEMDVPSALVQTRETRVHLTSC